MSTPVNPQIVPIFEAIKEEILKRDPDVTIELGAQRLHDHTAPPRILWVPSEDEYGPPVSKGERPVSMPGSAFTKLAGFDIHVWGADETATEELNRLFIEVCHLCIGGAFDIKSGSWEKDGETAENGIEYVLLITLKLPVTLSPDTTVQVTQWPITQTTMVT